MRSGKPHLFYGSIISFVLLVIFFVLRFFCSSLMDIDTKWLMLACVPLLIALIAGGYISKFSGFGFNIETVINKPLKYNSGVIDNLYSLSATDKQGMDELYQMPIEKKLEYNVLTFTLGRREYYSAYAISQYVTQLPNVRFFEFRDSYRNFRGLIMINRNLFLERNNNDIYINQFIRQIEEGRVEMPPLYATSHFIYSDLSLIEALEQMRLNNESMIAVLNKNNSLLGIVYRQVIESRLADAVLNSYRERE